MIIQVANATSPSHNTAGQRKAFLISLLLGSSYGSAHAGNPPGVLPLTECRAAGGLLCCSFQAEYQHAGTRTRLSPSLLGKSNWPFLLDVFWFWNPILASTGKVSVLVLDTGNQDWSILGNFHTFFYFATINVLWPGKSKNCLDHHMCTSSAQLYLHDLCTGIINQINIKCPSHEVAMNLLNVTFMSKANQIWLKGDNVCLV